MRLLNTSTFELETFFDSDHPPYAILSHTWGDQEVTFQEIQLEHSRSLLHSLRQRILEGETIEGFGTQAVKQGFIKILGCAIQAEKDDFKYIWCDTCNIDKTSSAELSEAINSMYHWYGNQTCYAYLADVPCARRFVDAIAYSEDFDFARWFRRGWTLQELIAPSEVTFFDQKWQPIGTRTELKSYIADITGIDQDVLSGEADPLTFSVAIRMSWASKRETTRKEDVAYCLIGLFGVHMPLIYGERERAFIRLEEEIMKTTDDHSLFAWRADASLAHQLEGGLLASSPLQFQDSHNIVPIINDNPDTQSPHFMTNKGISIPLPIFSVQRRTAKFQEIHLAVLSCRDITDARGPLGIYVFRNDRGGYRRCELHTLICSGSLKRTKRFLLRPQTMYVEQYSVTTRAITASPFHFHLPELDETLSAEGLEMGIYPRKITTWDSETRTLRCTRGIAAALSISRIGEHSPLGPILFIGISSAMSAWCAFDDAAEMINKIDFNGRYQTFFDLVPALLRYRSGIPDAALAQSFHAPSTRQHWEEQKSIIDSMREQGNAANYSVISLGRQASTSLSGGGDPAAVRESKSFSWKSPKENKKTPQVRLIAVIEDDMIEGRKVFSVRFKLRVETQQA